MAGQENQDLEVSNVYCLENTFWAAKSEPLTVFMNYLYQSISTFSFCGILWNLFILA